VQQVHVGPLCPQSLDITKVSDSATYATQCTNSFDYYYWLDKGMKNYSN
jgi:hypothetical protein